MTKEHIALAKKSFDTISEKYGPVLTGIGCLLAALDPHMSPSYYCYSEALNRPNSDVETECGIELSCYAGDVNMLHFFDFRDMVKEHGGFSIRDVAKEIIDSLNAYDVDEEVRVHMEGKDFSNAFTYKEATTLFEEWGDTLSSAVNAVQKTVEILEQWGVDMDARAAVAIPGVSYGLSDLITDNEIIEDGSLLLVQADDSEAAADISEGPWNNDACKGYLIIAMREAGFTDEEIKRASSAMTKTGFDQYTVEEAADYYRSNDIY